MGIASNKFESINRRLAQDFTVVVEKFNPHEFTLQNVPIVPTTCIAAFLVETSESSKVFNALKEVLYKPGSNRKTDKDKFRIEAHGAFLPYRKVTEASLEQEIRVAPVVSPLIPPSSSQDSLPLS